MQEFMRKLPSQLAVVAGILLLWMVYAEIAAFAHLRLANPESDLIPRGRLHAAYKNQSWVDTLADEWKPSSQLEYQAYVGWERRPFQGKAINVEPDGLRRTFHSRCTPGAYTIWMFGGSTVWGAGVPDWLTVPSLLGEQYEQDGRNVCVRNYAEKAWVNTQEVVKLILELKRQNEQPNLIVFYDGPADVYETYQSGRAGLHQNFDELKRLYEGHAAEGRANFQYLRKSNIALSLLAQGLGSQTEDAGSKRDADTIAQETVRCYFQNMDLVAALAREYKFDYAFMWQPTIHNGDKQLTPEEQTSLNTSNQQFPGLESADRAARKLIQAKPQPHLFDVADVFDPVRETVYFDQAHVSADANLLVAQRIYRIVGKSR